MLNDLNQNEIGEFVELLYPFILKKLENDAMLKNNIKMKNAVVSSISSGAENIGKSVEVRLPYDISTVYALNKSGENLKVGDTVCLMYWVDLKNAVIMFKTQGKE